MATQSDTWAYDKLHPEGFNTLKGDENFKPREADIPVSEQRKLSETHHKREKSAFMVSMTPEDVNADPQSVLQRRRSSVSSQKQGNLSSRKATGSYGSDSDLKPLSSLSSADKKNIVESGNNPLFFTSGLPSMTSGGN